MNEQIKAALEETIISCAKKAKEVDSSLYALQYTQSALNAAQVIIGLTINTKE